MSKEGLEVDAKEVLNNFADLTGKEQKKVYRNALRKAARLLVSESKQQLRSIVGSKVNSRNRWNGKTLGSGIKLKVDKDATEAKIHILGDFRLKFFEKGTVTRTLRKNGANRGVMTAHYFFRTAKENKENEVFSSLDNLISESINRIANRN
jgi:hypothetical protein